jgi:hypothetical protein
MEVYFNVPMGEGIAAAIQRRAKNIEIERGTHSAAIAAELRSIADQIRDMTIFEILEKRDVISASNSLHERCYQRLLLLAQKRETTVFHFNAISTELMKELSGRSKIELIVTDLTLSGHLHDWKQLVDGRKTRMITIMGNEFSHEAMRACQVTA